VDTDHNLLAGYHRYLAVRALGWSEIPAIVVNTDELRQELVTLDENIARHELSALERAEAEHRRKEIYEALYPLSRYGARRNILTKVESGDEDLAATVAARYEPTTLNPDEQPVKVEVPASYSQYAAQRSGDAERTVRLRLQIAEHLTPEVKELLRPTPLADDQKSLLRLCRLRDPQAQYRAAQMMVEGVPSRLAVERAQRELIKRDESAPSGIDPLLPPEIIYQQGDFREGLVNLVDGCAQLIVTDPPYSEDSLPLYEDLAKHAARVLEEGGSLICYVGQHLLPRVAELMSRHLRYWWTLALVHGESTQTLHGKDVWIRWKPVLWFVKGGRATREIVSDLISGSSPQKGIHPWAQGAEEIRPLIQALTAPGDLILDPFAGSGAFLWAAYLEGRRGLGYEIDPEHYTNGSRWLMEQYASRG
jgi:hypothetical protein